MLIKCNAFEWVIWEIYFLSLCVKPVLFQPFWSLQLTKSNLSTSMKACQRSGYFSVNQPSRVLTKSISWLGPNLWAGIQLESPTSGKLSTYQGQPSTTYCQAFAIMISFNARFKRKNHTFKIQNSDSTPLAMTKSH